MIPFLVIHNSLSLSLYISFSIYIYIYIYVCMYMYMCIRACYMYLHLSVRFLTSFPHRRPARRPWPRAEDCRQAPGRYQSNEQRVSNISDVVIIVILLLLLIQILILILVLILYNHSNSSEASSAAWRRCSRWPPCRSIN